MQIHEDVLLLFADALCDHHFQAGEDADMLKALSTVVCFGMLLLFLCNDDKHPVIEFFAALETNGITPYRVSALRHRYY